MEILIPAAHDVSNEARDDHGRWTAGGAIAPDRRTDDRADESRALAEALPDAASKAAYAVSGAIGHVAAAQRGRVETALDRVGRDKLAGLLAEYGRGRNMPEGTFEKTYLGDGGMTGTALAALREASGKVRGAVGFGDLHAASEQVGEALAALGPDRMGRAINGAVAAVQKLRTENIEALANLLEMEAGSTVDRVAMEAIGHTVLNRMARNGVSAGAYVANAYKTSKSAPTEVTMLAEKQLDGNLPDITKGATHFYSPKNMPTSDAPIEKLVGNDTSGGLIMIPGITKGKKPIASYRPQWAKVFEKVDVPNVPPRIAVFFRAPGDGSVQ
jgi:hypothetical protein